MSKGKKARPQTTPGNVILIDGKRSSVLRREAQDIREQKNRANYPLLKPWEASRKARHAERIARGLTYDNWRKNNSARSKDAEEPSVSNTVTRSAKRNNGSYVSKSYSGTFNPVANSQKA